MYWGALAFLSRRGAFVAAALLSSTVLLGVEARLAKTDATLLFTCLVGFGVLARAWFAHVSPDTRRPPTLAQVLAFWLAMGLGVLVKGPITPIRKGVWRVWAAAVTQSAASQAPMNRFRIVFSLE
jgi:4-amino-4-deoxy-L-arabinose transferase-like glycosyltransferase